MLTIKTVFSNTLKFLGLTMRGKKNAKAVAATVPEAEFSVDEITTLLNSNKGRAVVDIPQDANDVPDAEIPAKKSKGRGKKNAVEVETTEVAENVPDVELPASKPNARSKKAAAEIEVPQENGNSTVGRSTRKRAIVFYGTEVETPPKRVRVKKMPVTADDEAQSNGNVKETEAEAEVVPKANNRRGKKAVNKVEIEAEVPVKTTKGRGKKVIEPETVKEIENEEPVVVAPARKNGRTPVSVEHPKRGAVEEIIENASEDRKVTKKAKTTKGNNKKKEVEEEMEELEPQAAPSQEVEEAVEPEEEEEKEEEEKATTKSKRAKKAVTTKPTKGNNKNSTHITADEEPAQAAELVEKKSRKRTATAKVKANEKEEEEAATGKKVLKNATVTNYEEGNFDLNKDFTLKISSWNVAGMRSWIKKGGLKFFDYEKPDILCLQETKCEEAQLPKEAIEVPGYHPYWLCMPGGYAGVAIYSRIMPIHIEYGIGNEKFDKVGRIITAEYEKFYLINVYVPNAGRKLVNLAERMEWEQIFLAHVKRYDQLKPVIICGDMNVSHQEIDLANPKANTRNAGFTAEEREKMTQLLAAGFVDTFRHLYPKKSDAYTFWTYMGGARARNVGWRLDYFLTSERILPNVVDQAFRTHVLGSDHCPLTLFLNY